MKLKPEEVILTGRWLFDGRVSGDFVFERISWLTNHALQRLANSLQGAGKLSTWIRAMVGIGN
jgi:hypothetical protein